jgi:hypothetical protein
VATFGGDGEVPHRAQEVQGRELVARGALHAYTLRGVRAKPEGRTGAEIAERLDCTEKSVHKWRRGFAQEGLARLGGAPDRRGRFSS